ncbi:hypothetical protein Taro_028571 [Colocasia esculenta]|uniref:Uncharacterized protein n=1 Tax=Colocasia esculenta TaxID=4460 RepID=A0A843VUK8_COLES|nr:hypothetical protein [Colocasia esculenta]
MQDRIISGRERDEDIEDDVEIYAEYVPDPDVQERRARAESRAEAWEGDQRAAHRVSFQGAQHEVGSGSGSSSTIIEPLYEVLRVVDGERRPSIGLVYAKLEATKKKICDVSPRYAHLVLDVAKDRWDRQMSRDLHMAVYYLHPAYHYAHELAYEDDLTAAFTRVVERLSRSPVQVADAIDETSIGLSTSIQTNT